MTNISSSLTLMLKLFIPTFWMSFFTAFTLAFYFSEVKFVGPLPRPIFKVVLLIMLVFGFAFLYYTVMRLKRVELDANYIYATNYFKHVRYSFDSVERMEEKDWLLFRTISIHLKESGKFGKKLSFVASRKRLQKFIDEHPEVLKQLDFEVVKK